MTDPLPDDQGPSWEKYYQWLEGRAPRPLFQQALAKFEPAPAAGEARHAIDLGFGDGTETVALLKAGWTVTAIDDEPAAVARLESRVEPATRPSLNIVSESFENLELPDADFVYAGLSLPFCAPEHFRPLWGRLVGCLRPGGRFAGHFFGDRDDWVDHERGTFLPLDQVKDLFSPQFELEMFHEIDEDGESSAGPKHWHKFEVIARKTDRPGVDSS